MCGSGHIKEFVLVGKLKKKGGKVNESIFISANKDKQFGLLG